MQLLLVLVLGAAVGYFVGASKWGKNVDDATDKVTETTRGAADSAEGWFRRTFGKKSNVVDAESKDAEAPPAETPDGKVAAEKSVSRRKGEDTEAA